MAILLGLSAAVAYGAADFLAGLMSKRTSVLTVVLLSQLAGSVLPCSWPGPGSKVDAKGPLRVVESGLRAGGVLVLVRLRRHPHY